MARLDDALDALKNGAFTAEELAEIDACTVDSRIDLWRDSSPAEAGPSAAAVRADVGSEAWTGPAAPNRDPAS